MTIIHEDLSVRSTNILLSIGISKLTDLSNYTRDEFKNHKYMTVRCYNEVIDLMYLTGTRFKV